MDLADLEWRLIGEDVRPGPIQMALDEVAAETAAAGGPATLRVYRWRPSTVSLGYAQSPAVLDRNYCDRNGIEVTRRPTGGGTIYHDAHGDISYSIVVPAAAVPGDLTESYRMLCEPLFDALARLGVDADYAESERPAVFEPACYLRALHPAHDVVGPDGRKLSGNAQYRQRDAVIQHGSLTFERATDRHCAVFEDAPDADAFRERVGSITDYADVSREAAVGALTDALAEWAGADRGEWREADRGEWREAELAAARERAAEKYGSEAWIAARE
jgi:lipoate-protein ligase A